MARSAAMARDLRTLFGAGAAGGLTDGQLLDRFATRHGEAAEAAFAALVERHGPMVLGVCRRALADPRDVEDAFQATFLVLVKKARTVRVDDSLGRWLYGVTRRVASRARIVAARRRAREGEALVDRAGPGVDHERMELRGVLDEELGRLPEKYRAPMVLCYLEGLTHDVAAQQLGWPVGTVRGRLARARDRLRTRLAGRGLAPIVGPWPGPETISVVPPALAEGTVRAALQLAAARNGVSAAVLTLAGGAFRAAALSKLKMASAAVLAVAVSVPTLLLATDRPADRERPAEAPGAAARPARSKTMDESIKLAQRAFGPDHWAADPDLPVRHYNHERGYWMYARTYQRLNDGKQLRFRPFAIIWKPRDGKSPGLTTATGDEAIIDLDQPLGLDKAGPPMKVIHARVEGNVRLRDDRGTPDDPADDLLIGPMPRVEYDAARLEIRSESRVTIRDRDMQITGFGLRVRLRDGEVVGGLDGVGMVSLRSQVHVIAPDGKVGPEPAEEKPTPLEIRCTGAMQVDLAAPRQGAATDPSAPRMLATFRGDVVASRGAAGQAADQLECDFLRLELALAPEPTVLRCDAWGTGRAIRLQLKSQGVSASCSLLQYKPRSPKNAVGIYLKGDEQNPSRIETTADGQDRRKGEDIPIMVIGPGIFHSRHAPDRPAQRTATWQDRMVLKTETGPDNRPVKEITLTGKPELSGPEQATLGAGETIKVRLEPESPPARP